MRRTLFAYCSLVLIVSCALPSFAAPVPARPLRGTITVADGKPAAGAIVWAARHSYGPLDRHETTADAQGRYSLNLSPGAWFVWSRHGTQGGEGIGRHEQVTIPAGRMPDPVDIRLAERGTVRGRLLEAGTDKPIAGGKLFLDAGLVLTTNADGRFEVGGLFRTNHEAYVVAPCRMRMRVLFDNTARADTELDVPVPPAGKIFGRVTDEAGKPIPGAFVGRSTSGSYFSINGLYEACGDDGRFEYDDAVPPGQPTRLTASAPGHVSVDNSSLVIPPDGRPLEVNFKLRPKPTDRPDAPGAAGEKRRVVSGVVKTIDGKPATGVIVRWGYQPYVGAVQEQTGADGKFQLIVPDAEDYLAVLPRGYLPQFPKVVAGGDQTVDVDLLEGNTARGIIVDDTGKPIEGVRVVTVLPSPDPRIGNPFWMTEAAVRTGPDGRFAMKGLPDSARFDFLKSGLSDSRNQTLGFGDSDNAVTLQYGGAISGRAVGRDGKPIRSFRVLIAFPLNRQAGDQMAGFFAGYSGIGVRFTSPDGTFVLTGVGAGSVYRIRVVAEGHGEAVEDRVVAVPLNKLTATKPVALKAGPPVGLRVRAMGAEGKPVAGAKVTLVNGQPGLDDHFSWGYHDASWEDMARNRTGPDGWADFAALSFGGATVLVQAPGRARQRLGWRNGQKELTVELAPEAVLAGEVRDAKGELVTPYSVSLSFGGDQISTSVGSDATGRFRIAELPAGVWSVTIHSGAGRTMLYSGQVTLEAGKETELPVRTKNQ